MTPLVDALADAGTRTFEEMCFLYVSPDVSEEQAEAHFDGAIELSFTGPMRGRLIVGLAGGVLRELAANMLGDADGNAAVQTDALGEVGNVICGHLLPTVGGVEDVYQIGSARPLVLLPQFMPKATAHVRLGLESSGRADLLVFIDPAVTS
jgi:CheY-specific phosphatase CheX